MSIKITDVKNYSIHNAADLDRAFTHYDRLPARTEPNYLQEMRTCPLCGYSQGLEIVKLADFQFYSDQVGKNRITHRVVMCARCDTLYTNPCYTKKGFDILFEKSGESYGHSAIRGDEQCQWLLKRVPDCLSVLDFGCGDGAFLKSLPTSIRCIGTDANLDMQTTEENNIEFRSIDYSESPDIPRVDVVTMFHVLEHLVDPFATLCYLREKMVLGAYLVVEVPVLDRAIAEQDQDIVGFFSVQHLTHFSKRSLTTMLEKSGWMIQDYEDIAGYNGYRVLAKAGKDKTSVLYTGTDKIREMVSSYVTMWQKNIKEVEARLNAMFTSTIAIWGAGQHTEYLALLTKLFTANRRYLLVDSDPMKNCTTMHGISVLLPAKLDNTLWREGDFNIVISSYGSQETIYQSLIARGVAPSRVIRLYNTPNRY